MRDPRNGDLIRVVVVDDVIALPSYGWSGDGYGASISVEWLLHSPRVPLPLPRKGRRVLAQAIVDALQLIAGGEL